MRIIVSDSSALMDLRKGGLLEVFLQLPYEFAIPDVLLESELLSFTKVELSTLRKKMEIAKLTGAGIDRATAIVAISPALPSPLLMALH